MCQRAGSTYHSTKERMCGSIVLLVVSDSVAKKSFSCTAVHMCPKLTQALCYALVDLPGRSRPKNASPYPLAAPNFYILGKMHSHLQWTWGTSACEPLTPTVRRRVRGNRKRIVASQRNQTSAHEASTPCMHVWKQHEGARKSILVGSMALP